MTKILRYPELHEGKTPLQMERMQGIEKCVRFTNYTNAGVVKHDDDYVATDENKKTLKGCVETYQKKPVKF